MGLGPSFAKLRPDPDWTGYKVGVPSQNPDQTQKHRLDWSTIQKIDTEGEKNFAKVYCQVLH